MIRSCWTVLSNHQTSSALWETSVSWVALADRMSVEVMMSGKDGVLGDDKKRRKTWERTRGIRSTPNRAASLSKVASWIAKHVSAIGSHLFSLNRTVLLWIFEKGPLNDSLPTRSCHFDEGSEQRGKTIRLDFTCGNHLRIKSSMLALSFSSSNSTLVPGLWTLTTTSSWLPSIKSCSLRHQMYRSVQIAEMLATSKPV